MIVTPSPPLNSDISTTRLNSSGLGARQFAGTALGARLKLRRDHLLPFTAINNRIGRGQADRLFAVTLAGTVAATLIFALVGLGLIPRVGGNWAHWAIEMRRRHVHKKQSGAARVSDGHTTKLPAYKPMSGGCCMIYQGNGTCDVPSSNTLLTQSPHRVVVQLLDPLPRSARERNRKCQMAILECQSRLP